MANFSKIQAPVLVESSSLAGTYINRAVTKYTGANVRCVERRTSAPGSPVEGDCYLVGPTSTWPGGHLNEIACRFDGGYTYITPTAGLRPYIANQNSQAIYRSTGWCWIAQGPTAYTSISSSGTYTVEFTDTNNVCYTTTATGTFTLNAPASSVMSMGILYTIQFRNAGASGITVVLPNTQWTIGATNHSLSAGNWLIARIRYFGADATLPIVISVEGNTPPI